MGEGSGKKKYEGLWIPNEIRNIPKSVLNHLGKQVYAHIYSFGDKGCWQSNETIGKIFMVSDRTIRRKIAAIKKAQLVYIKSPKGYYRTMWAKLHPKVREAVELWYRGRQIAKSRLERGLQESAQLGQNCPSDPDKPGRVTGTNRVFPPGQNWPTTNKHTLKETNGGTKAADLPLPAGGQSSPLLEQRKAQQQAAIERFSRAFGKPKRRSQGLSPAELQERSRALVSALRADDNRRKKM